MAVGVIVVNVVVLSVEVLPQPAARSIQAAHPTVQPSAASLRAASQGLACTTADLWRYIHSTRASHVGVPVCRHESWHARSGGHDVVVWVADVDVSVEVLVRVEVLRAVYHLKSIFTIVVLVLVSVVAVVVEAVLDVDVCVAVVLSVLVLTVLVLDVDVMVFDVVFVAVLELVRVAVTVLVAVIVDVLVAGHNLPSCSQHQSVRSAIHICT